MNAITEVLILKVLYEAGPRGLNSDRLRLECAVPNGAYIPARESLEIQKYIVEIRGADRWVICDEGKIAWNELSKLLNEEIRQDAHRRLEEAEKKTYAAVAEERDKLSRYLAIVGGLLAACFVDLVLFWFWDFFAFINKRTFMVPIHASIILFVASLVPMFIYRPYFKYEIILAILAFFIGGFALLFSP